jgi:hypothetical protein
MSARPDSLSRTPPVDFWPEGMPSESRGGRRLSRREGLALCRYFLAELLQHRLEVYVKADPERTGCGVRAKSDCNPDWYRQFCGLHLRRRGRLTVLCHLCRGHHRRGGPCGRRKRTRAQATRAYKGTPNHHTIINRRETVRALERILSGGVETVYTERLKDFIRRYGHRYLAGCM